jgi:hypothetical protein
MGVKRTRNHALQEKRDIVQCGYETRTVISPKTHPVLFRLILTDIMIPQPRWVNRVDTIRAFRVLRGDKRRSFALRLRVQIQTNRWVTVSWRSSILLEFPTAKLQTCPIRAAMRQCVRRQICTFRRSVQTRTPRDRCPVVGLGLSCALCDQADPSMVYHVDHQEPTFAALVCTFLSTTRNRMDCPDPSVIQYGRNGRRQFPLTCQSFARRWRNFHQQHAVLRILCRDCNLRRSKH